MMHSFLQQEFGPFMTTSEVSHVLKISTQTIYNLTAQGAFEIPHYKHGKKLLFPTDAVADYIQLKLAG